MKRWVLENSLGDGGPALRFRNSALRTSVRDGLNRTGERRQFCFASFDDPQLLQRGWYDGSRFTISDVQPTSARAASVPPGTTAQRTLSIRRLPIFQPTDTVYLRYIKLSKVGAERAVVSSAPDALHDRRTRSSAARQPTTSPFISSRAMASCAWRPRIFRTGPAAWPDSRPPGGYNAQLFDSQEMLFNDQNWHCVGSCSNSATWTCRRTSQTPTASCGAGSTTVGDRPNQRRLALHRFSQDEIQPVPADSVIGPVAPARPDAMDR